MKKYYIIIGVVVLGVIVFNLRNSMLSKKEFDNIPVYSVKEGPLLISINESGTVESKDKIVLKSQVRGRNRIIRVVEEGRLVKKGDVLVELDSGELEEKEISQQIQVENADANLITARETLAITTNQVEADNEKAILTLKFAKLDLEKYIDGEYPQQLQQQEADIAIQSEELERNKDELVWSEKLADKSYITRSELQADELAVKKSMLNLQIAENKLAVLKKYTHPQQVELLKSDVKQAEMALDRTAKKGRADIIKTEANYRARQSEFNQQTSRLKDVREQLVFCKIIAPADGMVVYSKGSHRWDTREPLDVGVEVSERQNLLELPAQSNMIIKVSIPEASISKIKVGQAVLITIEGFPEQTFNGSVETIAILPDTSRSWMNPELKFYDCKITLNDPPDGIRPGNSCNAEIVLNKFDNVIYIPDQCVQIFKNQPIVFVMTKSGPERRNVETGLSNKIMVVIEEGLEVGVEVLLAPPLISEANDKETIK
ncbi:MAG: HlyD family efflux transporter periplasmic adaptor subunit [Kiritimatiellae bacterium]|jgi:HlyD family secretion protein|nr:HlyD family efflux transporter periplasmic adaptor subunit [Kiritimatiellia bacterium]